MADRSIAIDTSAFVAIFRQEPSGRLCRQVLAAVPRIVVPASCCLEVALLRREGDSFFDWFQAFTKSPIFSVAEIGTRVVDLAVQAARTYGKGSGHPAKLNFGDCFSYAVAKSNGLPLLFVGADFAHTDIVPALTPE